MLCFQGNHSKVRVMRKEVPLSKPPGVNRNALRVLNKIQANRKAGHRPLRRQSCDNRDQKHEPG